MGPRDREVVETSTPGCRERPARRAFNGTTTERSWKAGLGSIENTLRWMLQWGHDRVVLEMHNAWATFLDLTCLQWSHDREVWNRAPCTCSARPECRFNGATTGQIVEVGGASRRAGLALLASTGPRP